MKNYVIMIISKLLRYLSFKRLDGCWGDDPEIQAICELYDRPAEIWAYDSNLGAKKLRTFHKPVAFESFMKPPMRLSFYGGNLLTSI
jgi:OTU domain-containing protein 5